MKKLKLVHNIMLLLALLLVGGIVVLAMVDLSPNTEKPRATVSYNSLASR